MVPSLATLHTSTLKNSSPWFPIPSVSHVLLYPLWDIDAPRFLTRQPWPSSFVASAPDHLSRISWHNRDHVDLSYVYVKHVNIIKTFHLKLFTILYPPSTNVTSSSTLNYYISLIKLTVQTLTRVSLPLAPTTCMDHPKLPMYVWSPGDVTPSSYPLHFTGPHVSITWILFLWDVNIFEWPLLAFVDSYLTFYFFPSQSSHTITYNLPILWMVVAAISSTT